MNSLSKESKRTIIRYLSIIVIWTILNKAKLIWVSNCYMLW